MSYLPGRDTAGIAVAARRLAATALPALVVLPLLAAAAGPGGASAGARPGHPARASTADRSGPARPGRGSPAPVIDWALSGQVSASTSGPGTPAASATDGNAGSDWCPSEWTGTLTVDLGKVRSLDDLGITLDAASPSAQATIQVAARPGGWRAVPAARNIALDPGSPMYLPLPRGSQVRYAQLTVSSGTGAPVCVGAFRMLGPDPAAAGMALGADLSFTPQELAAGATFTYRGKVQSPVTIMRENGANYARIRLWTDPPPGYNDLAADLALARQVRAAGLKLLLDIQYSDFWADPSKQPIPAAWQGQDLAQLSATVQSYTRRVIAAFARQGTPADMVAIGNEIRNGMLWPARWTGQLTPAGTTWPSC